MMNNIAASLAALAIGAGAGGAAAYVYAKKKYDRIAREEIASVKEMYRKKSEDDIQQPEVDQKTDLMAYARKLRDQKYREDTDGEADETDDGIALISPEELGNKIGYEVINLTYYADGILADDEDEMIGDVEGLIGADALGSFGTYEDDAVHVRNHAHKCDYEILRDKRTYADVVRGTSHTLEE